MYLITCVQFFRLLLISFYLLFDLRKFPVSKSDSIILPLTKSEFHACLSKPAGYTHRKKKNEKLRYTNGSVPGLNTDRLVDVPRFFWYAHYSSPDASSTSVPTAFWHGYLAVGTIPAASNVTSPCQRVVKEHISVRNASSPVLLIRTQEQLVNNSLRQRQWKKKELILLRSTCARIQYSAKLTSHQTEHGRSIFLSTTTFSFLFWNGWMTSSTLEQSLVFLCNKKGREKVQGWLSSSG